MGNVDGRDGEINGEANKYIWILFFFFFFFSRCKRDRV